MTPSELNTLVKVAAAKAGFEHCGVARAEAIGREDYVRKWLAQGMAGSMDYLHRNLEKRLDPRELLLGAKSAIVVALNYKQSSNQNRDREGAVSEPKRTSVIAGRGPVESDVTGRIAMYAWGEDYHDVLRGKLREVEGELRAATAVPIDCKICVDTVPIVERELAAAAGIGWIAKNTLVIHPELGSYFFLGVLLTTLDIASDEPIADHCGTCTACLDACPTQAFVAPYQMDASRCISYLTIEHRGSISKPFQEMMGDWVFGCDVCQDVCPHNRRSPDAREPRFAIREPAPAMALARLLAWDEAEYKKAVGHSAMSRAKLDMLKRNAEIAQLNSKRTRAPNPRPENRQALRCLGGRHD